MDTTQRPLHAIDELYESVEAQLEAQDDISGHNPNFGTWVEAAIEQYLRTVDAENQKAKENTAKGMSGIGVEAGQVNENAADIANMTEEEDSAVVADENARLISWICLIRRRDWGLLCGRHCIHLSLTHMMAQAAWLRNGNYLLTRKQSASFFGSAHDRLHGP